MYFDLIKVNLLGVVGGQMDERGIVWTIGAVCALPFILGIVKLCLSIRREFRTHPSADEKFAAKESMLRVEARLEKIERDMRDTATKSELRQIEAQFKSFEGEIRRALEENDNKSEQRALKTHGRINEVLAAVSRLQGKLEK